MSQSVYIQYVLGVFYSIIIVWSAVSDEGVYINSNGGRIKDVRLQWGEVPSSIG